MENDKNKEKGSVTSKDGKARFQVQWNTSTLWAWDIGVDICSICRYHNIEACFDCQIRKEGKDEECKMARGVCGHTFHLHCIQRWLENRHVCPIDTSNWEYYHRP